MVTRIIVVAAEADRVPATLFFGLLLILAVALLQLSAAASKALLPITHPLVRHPIAAPLALPTLHLHLATMLSRPPVAAARHGMAPSESAVADAAPSNLHHPETATEVGAAVAGPKAAIGMLQQM